MASERTNKMPDVRSKGIVGAGGQSQDTVLSIEGITIPVGSRHSVIELEPGTRYGVCEVGSTEDIISSHSTRLQALHCAALFSSQDLRQKMLATEPGLEEVRDQGVMAFPPVEGDGEGTQNLEEGLVHAGSDTGPPCDAEDPAEMPGD